MLPLLRESPKPRIVNLASSGGSLTLNSVPTNPHRAMFGTYSASKAAANAVTVAFAADLEAAGIKVNAACPGFTARLPTQVPTREHPQLGNDRFARECVLAATPPVAAVRPNRDQPADQTSRSRAARARNATPRWLIASFSSESSSAVVRTPPVGTKIGS